MRKYLALILFFPVIFSNCKKSKSQAATSLNLTANDSTFLFTSTSSDQQTNGTLMISANTSSYNREITLELSQYKGLGTYNIDMEADSGANYDGNVILYKYFGRIAYAKSGQIVVKNTTGTIDGTFSFTGAGVIASGSFTANKP